MTPPPSAPTTRQRLSASERREALVEAAVAEFAHGGLHGTPVERIAKRVGVTQPYVFSLFGGKRDLFLAAVQRGFDTVSELFATAAENYRPDPADPEYTRLKAMGGLYLEALQHDRSLLMMQYQGYAACDDPVIRDVVRASYARLLRTAQELSGATPEEVDEFIRYGMSLNVAAAMGVPDLSCTAPWVEAELR